MSTTNPVDMELGESFSSSRSRRSLLLVPSPQKLIRFKRFLQRNDVRLLFAILSLVHFFLASELWFYTLGDTPTSVLENPELGAWERRWRFLKVTHPIVSGLVLECSIVLQLTALYAAVWNRAKLLLVYTIASGLFSLLLLVVSVLGAVYHYLYGFSHRQMHQWWMLEHHQHRELDHPHRHDHHLDEWHYSSHQALYMFLALGCIIGLLALLQRLADRLFHDAALRKRAKDEERFGCSIEESSTTKSPRSGMPVTAGIDAISIHFD